MVTPGRLERSTHGLEGRCSIQLSYGAKIQLNIKMERVMGIGPTQLAWKARALPLSYTRMIWSERQDLNLRPPAPKAGALPN